MNKGMTIIEVLVIVSVISILTVIFLLDYRVSSAQLTLQRAANKLAQDIRKAQGMAMSAVDLPGGGTCPETGYGIVFDTVWNDTKYRLYADTSGDEFFQSLDIVVETIDLEKGIYIKEIYVDPVYVPKASINFKPPDPETKIKYLQDDDQSRATITLALQIDPSKTKTITINKLGLITIE